MTMKEIKRLKAEGHPDTVVYTEIPINPVQGNALACVNNGRWLAHCPRPGCANAMLLVPGQGSWSCSECYARASVDWPADAEELWVELQRRPNPVNRNWYPDTHDWARTAGLACGQSVAELREEFAEHGGEG